MRVLLILAAAFIALVTSPAAVLADSAQRLCVPDLAVKPSCQLGFPTIQAAIDAADPNDSVYVGAGAYVEQLTITGKGVRLTGVPGAGGARPVILDDGLPFREAHIAFVRSSRPELVGFEIRTSSAGAAVSLGSSVNAIIKRNVLVGTAPVGLHVRAPGEGEPENSGFAVLYNTFAGFDTAVRIEDSVAIAVEKSRIAAVGVGIEIARLQVGQLFWNVIEDAGTAIRVRNSNHTDVNSNRIVRAGVGLSVEQHEPLPYPALRVTPANDVMEYGHNRFVDTLVPVSIQLGFPDDGGRSSDPRDDPGGSAQWVDNEVDGVPLPKAKTRPGVYK
jgi:hypothetical protein